jgi:signal transduction histidine kinase
MSRDKLELPTELDLVEFISKEAHDLKSPFNRILGFTKMMLKGMDGPINDMQKDDLTTVYQNGSHAMTMMSNLVDMARLGRGEKTFSPAACDAKNLVNQVIAYWTQNHSEKSAEIEARFAEENLPFAADEALLRQAVGNWISYIAEYLENPARVQIHVELVGGNMVFTLQGRGKRSITAAACDLTMWSYIALQIISLHRGKVETAEADETSILFQFSLPC